MRWLTFLSILAVAGLSHAQDGQQGSRPGWPCVAGAAVDPAYLELSESTGGQLFLLQKGEVGQSGPAMSASYTHPATVLRAVGRLNGERDFEFPVDSTIESLMVLASLQCRSAIGVFRPSGAELTSRNSALSVELTAGKILRVDHPEAGKWRIRLAGTGLFVLSALAKTDISLAEVSFFPKRSAAEAQESSARLRLPLSGTLQDLEIRLSGQVSGVTLQLMDATGARIAALESPRKTEEGVYRTTLASSSERYRIMVTGEDAAKWAFQRTYPVLYRPRPAN